MDFQGYFLTIGLIASICTLLDWITTPEETDSNRLILTKWYTNLSDYNYINAISAINLRFLNVFDSIYGKKHFSIRCVLVSFITSILTVILLSIALSSSHLLFVALYNEDSYYFYEFIGIGGFLLITNCLIDYFSLLETRIILGVGAKYNPVFIPFFLIIDLLLTVLIFLMSHYILGYLGFISLDIEGVIDILSVNDGDYDIFSWVFFSTFITSIIYYIFVLAHLLLKALSIFKTRLLEILIRIESSGHIYKAIATLIAVVSGIIKSAILLTQNIA